MVNIAVLLSCRGSNFISIKRSIDSGEIQNAKIVCVISNKPNAAGLQYAIDAGIPAIFVDPKKYSSKKDYDISIVELLQQHDVGLVCLAGYMRIVSNVIVDKYYGKILNIHPSLLPSFPGLDAQRQAIDKGVKVSGCTVHFVDNGMDTGPIIAQSVVNVLDDDTEETLSQKILVEEHKLYPKVVSLYTAGKILLVGDKTHIK